MLSVVGKVVKPLSDIGLGKLPGVSALYKFAWSRFGPKGIRTTSVDEFNLSINCADWAVAPTMMFSHTWEPEETKLVKHCVREGMIAVDIGAHIGYYTVLMSKMVGEKGLVYAFEPSLNNQELLRKNVLMNDCNNVEIFRQAVGDKAGYANMYLNATNSSGDSMFTDDNGAREQTSRVPITTLDRVIGGSRVDFIKMDVEGAETRALLGMTGVLRNNRDLKMIIEVFPKKLEEANSGLEELVSLLIQSRFRLHIIGKGGLGTEAGLGDIRAATDKYGPINLFCYKL
jgi:FkbM family methyltransferase